MIGNWLFDDARQSGDTDVLEVNDDYYVAVFHDRYLEESNTVSVRHIPVSYTHLQMYQAFFPAETEGENEADPDNGLVILKVIHEDGEDLLSTLDSDEELEAVYEQFMEQLFRCV